MHEPTANNFLIPEKIKQLVDFAIEYFKNKYQTDEKLILESAILKIKVAQDSDYNGLETQFGHTICLFIPVYMFLKYVDAKGDFESKLQRGLNVVNTVDSEYIYEVKIYPDSDIELIKAESCDFSEDTKEPIKPKFADHLWIPGYYKVFLSHKVGYKQQTAKLKDQLQIYGISCFVAHEDLPPTAEWMMEIENALRSMDAFVALLTEDFKNSEWTGQEIGFACARKVPIIPIRLGCDPYGFIGKIQALCKSWENAPNGIFQILIKEPKMKDAFISAIENCPNFDTAALLFDKLKEIKDFSAIQIENLVNAYNSNSQVYKCFKFRAGIVSYLRSFGYDNASLSEGLLNLDKNKVNLSLNDYHLSNDMPF